MGPRSAAVILSALACGGCADSHRAADAPSSTPVFSSIPPVATAPTLTLAWSVPLAGAAPGIEFVTDAVAAAPDGSVFVVDATNAQVVHVSAAGAVLTTWGGPGTESGQFNFQHRGETVLISSIAADPTGNVYVAEAGNSRIQKFDADGHFITPPRPGARNRGAVEGGIS